MTSLRNDKKRECRRITELNIRMIKEWKLKRKIGIKKYEKEQQEKWV